MKILGYTGVSSKLSTVNINDHMSEHFSVYYLYTKSEPEMPKENF